MFLLVLLLVAAFVLATFLFGRTARVTVELFGDVALSLVRIEVFVRAFIFVVVVRVPLLRFGLNTFEVRVGRRLVVRVAEVVFVISLVLRIVTCRLIEPHARETLTFLPRFLMLSFLELMKSNSLPYSSFSMLLNVWVVPDFSSTSKSKDLVLPPPRAKFTDAISSNRM